MSDQPGNNQQKEAAGVKPGEVEEETTHDITNHDIRHDISLQEEYKTPDINSQHYKQELQDCRSVQLIVTCHRGSTWVNGVQDLSSLIYSCTRIVVVPQYNIFVIPLLL